MEHSFQVHSTANRRSAKKLVVRNSRYSRHLINGWVINARQPALDKPTKSNGKKIMWTSMGGGVLGVMFEELMVKV